MKNKEIHLDFTPLLDVTLIILFYFILFSNIGAKSAAEVQQMRDEAQTLSDEAQERLKALDAADNDKAQVALALEEYGRGGNINLVYGFAESGGWRLDVKRGDETLRTMSGLDDITAGVLEVLEQEGYTEESYLLMTLTYDSTEYLINARYRIEDMIESVNEKYKGHVFVSEVNTHKEETNNESEEES